MSETVVTALIRSALVVLAYMTAWWLASLALKRSDIADIAWGPGFPLIGLASIAAMWGRVPPALMLMTGLTTAWSVRLALHITTRRRGSGEDFRYAGWREQWGRLWLLRSYLQVFLLQGLFMLVVAAPLIVASVTPAVAIGAAGWIGAGVWFAGLCFEAVADAQLAAFKRDPANKGRIMDRGLWSWSRHPNYFGEAVLWWGVWMVGLGSPLGWVAILGPLTITYLLRFVSGVPLLEKHYEGNAEFEAYKRRTSVFVPLPPKRA
jgi:steroid 5-alpha reductase family enzyme